MQILGLIENMSYFKCPHCSEPSYIFGKGGARKTADEMGLGFVGEVCLFPYNLFLYYTSCYQDLSAITLPIHF